MHDYTVTVSLYTDGTQTRVAEIDPQSNKKDSTGATFTGTVPILSHATSRHTPMRHRRLHRIECRCVIESNRSFDFCSGDLWSSRYLSRVQPFLTANWRYLAMVNYVVDPRLIAPLVPSGTEIDFEHGETFLSVVGFLFLDTRLMGMPVPLHRDFEEVNLRFYVRRKSADTWRRGVVFIRELVPRRAIALIARSFYGENYVSIPMKHEIEDLDGNVKVKYSWRRGRKWESLKMNAVGERQAIPAGSHAEFITEHYWGYTALRSGCSEYRVEHARWKIWNATSFKLNADVATLYGERFVETLSQPPRSAFIADGSSITVQKRQIVM